MAARLSLLVLLAAFAVHVLADVDGCDPLVPEYCAVPMPNNYWTVKYPKSETGLKTQFPANLFPADKQGRRIDPSNGWNALDGFSPIAPILSYFADMVLDGVPKHQDIEPSLLKECPTVLLDTSTGERVAHWGELDMSGDDDEQRLFMIWPAQRLKASTRYIVAIRDIKNSQGTNVPPSAAFQALRDDEPTTIPGIDARRSHFEDLFASLADAGVQRSTLQLAWDFTVSSRKNNTDQLISMRDDALSRLPTGGPKYYITSTEENPNAEVARFIEGKMEVPLYMTSARPGALLVLDTNNIPVFQGFTNVTFNVQVSANAVAMGGNGLVLQYGHGLFGSTNELGSGWLRTQANDNGWVLGGTNWWGMSSRDVVQVTSMLTTNLTNFPIIPDRCQQGLVNQVVLSRLLLGDFAKDPVVTFNGVPAMDTSELFYYGNSQGGIIGSVMMAITQDIEKGVLGVPGAPYSLMLLRSVDFDPYYHILQRRFPNAPDLVVNLNAMQLLWDRSEGSGYMDAVVTNTLPNTPPHRVILHYGLSDAQVSWLSCLAMSRSMGAVVFPNNVEERGEKLYGFLESTEPVREGAVMVGFFYDTPEPPETNNPPLEENDTHSCPRKDPRAQQQINEFFETGVVVDYCHGEGCGPIPLGGCDSWA